MSDYILAAVDMDIYDSKLRYFVEYIMIYSAFVLLKSNIQGI